MIPQHRSRWPALDGLRGVAVLMVVVFHTSLALPGGFIGVDLFFVLSGYLITTLLFAEIQASGRICLWRFYLSRAARLVPSLTVMVAASLLVAVWLRAPGWRLHEGLMDAPWVLLSLGNWKWYLHPTGLFLAFIPTWSLAVEWQFYVMWPLILAGLVMLRARPRWFVGVAVIGVTVPVLLRCLLFEGPADWFLTYMRTDTRVDGLFWGCLAAGLGHWSGLAATPWRRQGLRAAALAAVTILGIHAWTFELGEYLQPTSSNTAPLFFQQYAGFTLIDVCCVCLILALVAGVCPALDRVLKMQGLVWVGHISYSVYLCHLALFSLLSFYVPGPIGVRLLLHVALAVAGGCVLYYTVERPSLRLKRWLAGGPNAPPASAGDATGPSQVHKILCVPLASWR